MAGTLSRHGILLFASRSYESYLENQILSVGNPDREYQVLNEKTAKMKKIK